MMKQKQVSKNQEAVECPKMYLKTRKKTTINLPNGGKSTFVFYHISSQNVFCNT